MRGRALIDTSARLVFYPVMVASIYFLFAGHNQPGGGFVGGLVAGAAIALRYIAGGIDDVRSLTPFKPWTILGSGLLVAGTTAGVSMFLGDPALTNATVELAIPVIGDVKFVTALFFDVGVYLLVVGLVLMVFESFADDPEVQPS